MQKSEQPVDAPNGDRAPVEVVGASPAGSLPMSRRESVHRCSGNSCELEHDELAIEEPLQIRLAGEDVAVAMRTPGNDIELAVGFLYTEGIIASRQQIEAVGYCLDGAESPEWNVINVLPADRALLEPGSWGRNFISSSSCGLCGKTSIEQVIRRSERPANGANGNGSMAPGPTDRIPLELLYSLPGKLRGGQDTFDQTGGLHAAGLFDTEGNLLVLREDVGRHNAVDKVIGYSLLNDMLPLDRHILVVSSRASFEIVQKAVTAGVRVMAVLSAPSSLAVQLAREAGMTLVAFLREQRLNVYAGDERLLV